MDIIYELPPWLFSVGVLTFMFAANELGYRLGRAHETEESERSYTVSTALKASIYGLIALLLGFSYSVTSSRFHERQRLVLDEANAIGTCYLRGGLLEKDQKTASAGKRIRAALRTYTDLRLELYERALEPEQNQRISKAMDDELAELWSAVDDAFAEPSMVIAAQIVPAANEVIDLSATRAWATHNHLSPPVIVLLAACMIVSSFLTGHSSGKAARRHVGLWIALNILVALVLFVILDFDRTRRGLIQINHAPLVELRQSMQP